jgi:hypothetical protein
VREQSLPFKANANRRHRIPRQRQRVTNWPAYEAGLRARGSLTVWFSEEAIEGWRAAPRTTRGGQPLYPDLAIATALTLRAVFRLALRQTEGLITSILALLGLDLAVPDHSTMSRRAETLEVARPPGGREPVHLLVDSTGLRLCGPGEWLCEKHRTKRCRAWRKLHLATDADTGRIIATKLTGHDAETVGRSARCSEEWAKSRPSLATAHTIATTSMPRSRRVIRMRTSLSRHDRAQCRVRQPGPRRRSGTDICRASPSAAAWDGRRPLDTTGALSSRRCVTLEARHR